MTTSDRIRAGSTGVLRIGGCIGRPQGAEEKGDLDMVITKGMLQRGFDAGVVSFCPEPCGTTIMCRIGESRFYFGGAEADACTASEYMAAVGMPGLFEQAARTLAEGIRHDFPDEHAYYEEVLREALGIDRAGTARAMAYRDYEAMLREMAASLEAAGNRVERDLVFERYAARASSMPVVLDCKFGEIVCEVVRSDEDYRELEVDLVRPDGRAYQVCIVGTNENEDGLQFMDPPARERYRDNLHIHYWDGHDEDQCDEGIFLDPEGEGFYTYDYAGWEAAIGSLINGAAAAPHDNAHCPVCGSSHVSGDFISIDEGCATQGCTCEECSASWTDVYLFDRCADIEKGA